MIRGPISFQNALQEDFVALKSDGFPTYHLAMAVDDTKMEMTHVVRSDEWISSAPKHIQLFEAFGWEPPRFAHLPLVLGPDHKKLSKRHGDTAVLGYRDNGYLPEAMVNFLALLGWSLDDHTSLVCLTDLRLYFSLDRVVPNPAVFDIERLNFLNGHYIRDMDDERWHAIVTEWCERGLPPSIPRPIDAGLVAAVAPLLRERVAHLDEIAPLVEFLFGFDAPSYPAEMLTDRLGGDNELTHRVIDAALLALDRVSAGDWDKESVEQAVRSMEASLEMKLRKFVPVLYVAEMGRPQGIPLFDSMALLGRERTLQRLRAARMQVEHRH
jgi:glutamyl-tRNA synthetase